MPSYVKQNVGTYMLLLYTRLTLYTGHILCSTSFGDAKS